MSLLWRQRPNGAFSYNHKDILIFLSHFSLPVFPTLVSAGCLESHHRVAVASYGQLLLKGWSLLSCPDIESPLAGI